jgi:hypothetical protein
VTKTVIVEQGILDGQPIRSVSYLKPVTDWDSGFAAWCNPPSIYADGELVHLACFLDEHPDIREGMGVAKAHGVAIHEGNTWHPLRETRDQRERSMSLWRPAGARLHRVSRLGN